jgi:uncharacterized membrane protein (DUF485 family)
MTIILGGVVDVVTTRDAKALSDAWIDGIGSAEFKSLVDAKRRAIVPMTVIYIVGYMGLSILAGFGRNLLGIKVLGFVNLGFVLIAGNYLMAWLLGVVYARISANRHDPLVKLVIDRASTKRRPQ